MSKKVLPKDTNISKYFEYKGRIFENMQLPDGRVLIKIVHTWGDGEIMSYGFQYSDDISRTGINPLHIVAIFSFQVHPMLIEDKIDIFLAEYNKSESKCAG